VLAVAVLLLTGCAPTYRSAASPDVPYFSETARGDARFTQWLLVQGNGRKTLLVDVTAGCPDPHHTVVRAAFVLVDATSPVGYPRDDYRHRPVVVRYTSARAARCAVLHHDPRSFGRREATVLWVPPGLPPRLADEYKRAGSVGVM
jgi:hypothetical protein